MIYGRRPQKLRTARLTSRGSGVDLAVTFFHLESDKQIDERRWHGERVDDRWLFKCIPPELDALKREVTYSIDLWKAEDDDKARREWERGVAEEARAKAEWIGLRPRLEALKANGHFISLIYAAEGGQVEWTWSDSKTSNYETARIAKEALIEAKSLLDQKKLSEKEMKAVIGALSPYYIEDDEDVWQILHPDALPANPKATKVLAAAQAAMGYKPATSGAHTYSASWKMSQGPGSLPTSRDVIIDVSTRRLSRVDARYDFFENRMVETVKLVVNGDRAVRTVHGNRTPVLNDVGAYFAWSNLDLVPQMLAVLSEKPERLRYAGPITIDERTVDRIQLVWHNKVTDEFDFDAKTHLLLERRQHQTEDQKKMFEGKFAANGDYSWKYEKYERHAGLMIPMTVTVYDPIGVSTEVQQCTAVAVDPQVSDAVFAVP
jgi:hypothetical protein